MIPYYQEPNITIYHGDCLEIMPSLAPDSIDAIVTDPPYGLEFMGKDWDKGVPGIRFWTEALRVAKPGCHLLAFGGTRTFHRLVCAIEDAGWEIRDTIGWIYGSGFPKSLNIGKAIDKMQGNEREIVGGYMHGGTRQSGIKGKDLGQVWHENSKGSTQWEGWGTALKPAWEPIIVARKPLIGTVAENVLKFGTGGINIDGCRIETDGRPLREVYPLREDVNYNPSSLQGRIDGSLQSSKAIGITTQGRFPANLIHDGSDEVMAGFPNTKSGKDINPTTKGAKSAFFGHGNEYYNQETNYGDSGSAARFFYCAKASKSERDEGLEGIEKEIGHNRFDKCSKCGGYILQNPDRPSACKCENPTREHNRIKGNFHPTVKPLALMRYLCRLVTPPNGLILDPFMGSGSTGKAARQEGFRFIGIDTEADYCEIAKRRMIKIQEVLPFNNNILQSAKKCEQ